MAAAAAFDADLLTPRAAGIMPERQPTRQCRQNAKTQDATLSTRKGHVYNLNTASFTQHTRLHQLQSYGFGDLCKVHCRRDRLYYAFVCHGTHGCQPNNALRKLPPRLGCDRQALLTSLITFLLVNNSRKLRNRAKIFYLYRDDVFSTKSAHLKIAHST